MNQPTTPEKSPSEQLKELESVLDIFHRDGWKHFIKEKQEVLENYQQNAHEMAPDNDNWQRLRGHIFEIKSLIAYEDYIRISIEHLQEEVNGETEED